MKQAIKIQNGIVKEFKVSKLIVVVEPFYAGSHKQWTDSLIKLFKSEGNQVELLSLPGRHWKWRMHGAAVTLGVALLEKNLCPDVLICSDMLDLATFKGCCGANLINAKIIAYFHENQLTYPWSKTDADVQLKRDANYAYKNFTTALVADKIYFNSNYHKESFLKALPEFLATFPDYQNKEQIDVIKEKSSVLYLGIDLAKFDLVVDPEKKPIPVILWNHRWEYDKNPEGFYKILLRLKKDEINFKLIVCGEQNKKYPKVFDKIKTEFGEEIIFFGFAEEFKTYAELLKLADVYPVTNIQDFFGGSIVEAIYCGVFPLLPNRLSYDEHVPDSLKNDHLFDDEETLYQGLKVLLTNRFKPDGALRKYVKRYDWETIKKDYLQILNGI